MNLSTEQSLTSLTGILFQGFLLSLTITDLLQFRWDYSLTLSGNMIPNDTGKLAGLKENNK